MLKPGRKLEEFVALLERVLVPDGATVKSPDYLPDRVTGELREVDVSIRMQVGSSELLVIAECRDRKGREDVIWIEQLAQKRDDLHASRAIAVSSAGFSKTAVAKASFYNIDIRAIDELTPDDIRSWFLAEGLIVKNFRTHFYQVTVNIDGDRIFDDETCQYIKRGDWVNAEIFICKNDSLKYSISTIWNNIINQKREEFHSIIPLDGTKIRQTTVVQFPNPDNRYQAYTPDGLADIIGIRFIADLWYEESVSPIHRILAYKNDKKSFIETVEFEINQGNQPIILQIHRDTEHGHCSLSANIVDDQPLAIEEEK